jgi:hypothetical protein
MSGVKGFVSFFLPRGEALAVIWTGAAGEQRERQTGVEGRVSRC